MTKVSKEQDSNNLDWGNPPAPITPENKRKVFRAQLILGVFTLLGILVPGLMFWFLRR